MSDIIEVLLKYQKWTKEAHDNPSPSLSISIEDIDENETFGRAAKEITRLREEVSNLKNANDFLSYAADEAVSELKGLRIAAIPALNVIRGIKLEYGATNIIPTIANNLSRVLKNLEGK